MAETTTIDIYPVGWLAAWQHRKMGHLRSQYRYTVERIRQGDWHAVKGSLNGYLAEPTPFPVGLKRCGSGWTKRRALRSWQRQLEKANSRD